MRARWLRVELESKARAMDQQEEVVRLRPTRGLVTRDLIHLGIRSVKTTGISVPWITEQRTLCFAHDVEARAPHRRTINFVH
jgi:hypothetical protein